MNTVGVCLIYFGMAIFGYQSYSWISDATWTSYSIMSLWQTVLASPRFDGSALDAALYGAFHWPAAAALLVAGVAVIAAVQGSRWFADIHAARARRQWIAEQCRKVGYYEWRIPGILASFDQDDFCCPIQSGS